MASRKLSLPHQTLYAELVELCAIAAMEEEFSEPGAFSVKEVKGRRYWYFEPSGTPRQRQRYVGPETPELLRRIQERKAAHNQRRIRRQMVSALTRAGLRGPDSMTAAALAALSKAGVFRLPVLVGTLAFQTYAPMLGIKVAASAARTGDIDIAQMHEISTAVGDRAGAPLEILRSADPTFRPVPSLDRKATSYINADGLRVEFLAPKKREAGTVNLPALQTHAQALGYIDYLITEPVQAVVLSGPGILVNVPDPARYAWHKLVIAGERRNKEKAGKDLEQARILIEVLAERSAEDLKEAAQDFLKRQSRKRKDVFRAALARLPLGTRETALRTLGWPRNMVPGAHLAFSPSPPRWDSARQVLVFSANEGGVPIECAISREALEDHFPKGRQPVSRDFDPSQVARDRIERLAKIKYLDHPIPPGTESGRFGVLLRSTDDLPWPKRTPGRRKG
ncbi:MAG TPA: GSU2403 family nucleotidyltransferase fold protein [Alphaproteobacteria bacterium]|nr:GSU2403 family nucleotidyltransferase fold protein [Alphaproteobacteria bacterium]